MKKVSKILSLLLALTLLAGCGTPGTSVTTAPETSGAALEQTEPSAMASVEENLARIAALGESPEDNYRVWYELFVYSFCDSNGDGIGDLQGVISKLDYLQELGVNGIWFMPIHPSTSYHKYNVSDYLAIDPDYGTMADFEALMAECDRRGIRVILDLVVNHTGSDHKWFTTATNYLRSLGQEEPDSKDCPFVEYYHFSREGGTGYQPVAGTDWYYEAQFSPDMPDLNLENPALRQELEQIMAFWLDKGVAGFRLDAAKEFYSGNGEKNIQVLSWLQETVTRLNPQAYLVAEVWDSLSTITSYYASGITSIFDYPYGDSTGKIVNILRGAGDPDRVTGYASYLEKTESAYRAQNPDFIDAPFLSNHDVGRIAGFVAKDENLTKLAAAMNLMMGGSAFVYYGEELGMTGSGNDPSKRAPMYWNDRGDEGMTQPPPECVVPETYPFPAWEGQREDPASIYNYYRQAIALRKALPVISHGAVTVEEALNQGCVSAQRKTWGDSTCIILMNIQDAAAQVDLSGYDQWTLAAGLSANGEAIALSGTTLELAAYGVAVLIPKA